MTVLFLVLAVIGLKVLPIYLTAWVLPGLLIPLLQPSEVHALMSMPRFVLVLFPLFIVLGKLIRPTVIRIPWYDRLGLSCWWCSPLSSRSGTGYRDEGDGSWVIG